MTEAERLHRALGRRVRELRQRRTGLTQERLGHGASLHPVFVSRVERGATGVTVDTVAALCGVLGVTLAEFFEPFTQVPRLRGPGRRRRT
jgi:transcriptional regulator with XRE-family HTH domain